MPHRDDGFASQGMIRAMFTRAPHVAGEFALGSFFKSLRRFVGGKKKEPRTDPIYFMKFCAKNIPE